ncbi:MAG TPA: ATP-binding protein [Candidatus Paceibacterota bacterium]|nr:ATP-binding protein [Candidatus Paceibacterota bacterium]
MPDQPQKSGGYMAQPEFRPVFYITPLLLAIVAISFIYMPPVWAVVSAGTSVLAIGLLGALSFKIAKANTTSKIQTQQMHSVITHLNIGVVAYDNDFNVLIFNPAAQEIFQLSERDVLGLKLSTSMASDVKYMVLAQVIFSSLAPTVIKRSDPGVYPQVIDVSFDEPRLDLRVITDRIFDEQGKIIGFIKLITNRTRETELLKSKTEFITVAAHQLRTPLTAVNWALESLENSQLQPQQKELVDTGFLSAKKMLKTVNDLLDVSKIEEGRFGYQFEEVNIVSFIESILSQSMDVAKQYGIKLYFSRPESQMINVYIDQQKMSMVLFNLIDNAIKYNVENGEVTVSIEPLPGESFVRISIKDTGIGIPSNQIEKLFTKFFRADNVVKFAPDGTGMGLYIVKNVITRHGGRVWAESELNRGTTFYFTIPTNRDVIPKKELIEFE